MLSNIEIEKVAVVKTKEKIYIRIFLRHDTFAKDTKNV